MVSYSCAIPKPVLVDSSVWISYFKREEPAFTQINRLAETKRIRLLGLILAELYQGCKSRKEVGVINDLIDIFPRFEEKTGMWEEAGILSFKLRRQGKTVGLADCFIAVAAQQFDALVYSYDKHFEELARRSELTIYNPNNSGIITGKDKF